MSNPSADESDNLPTPEEKAGEPTEVTASEEAPAKTTRKRSSKAKSAKTQAEAQDASEAEATAESLETSKATAEAKAGDESNPGDAAQAQGGGPDGGDGEDNKQEKEAPPEKELPPVPETVDLNELHERPLSALHRLAVEAELRVAGIRSKHQLLFELVSYYGRRGTVITAEGILEQEGNGYGFLRWPRFSFNPLADDIYVSPSIIRKKDLRPGQKVSCTVRVPKDREKFFAVDQVLTIEGIPEDQWEARKPFDKLTALFPKERIILEVKEEPSISSRIVDLVAPLGKGQRGLIAAPPRGGKTLLLKDIARSIHKNYPDVELIVLLLDERPEEVTDFQETVEVPVFASTFDEAPKRHIQVAEMVSERAKRLVEMGKDVVILLDSLTRLARGYNRLHGGGKIGTGGLGTKALEKPRKFFGAARNVEEGGSLTVLATALIETESKMDEAIFEEFKGTGNMELQLDRELVEKRIFPAIHLRRSATRNDEKLYHPDEFKRITILRRELAQLPAVEAMEVLMRNVHLTRSNAELLLKGLK